MRYQEQAYRLGMRTGDVLACLNRSDPGWIFERVENDDEGWPAYSVLAHDDGTTRTVIKVSVEEPERF